MGAAGEQHRFFYISAFVDIYLFMKLQWNLKCKFVFRVDESVDIISSSRRVGLTLIFSAPKATISS